MLFSSFFPLPFLNPPQNNLQSLSDCFKQLKQRIIWKFENESLADLPSNVIIRKWLPQNDILAHPNVVLFISHGGVFGSVESIWHGVPLLITPFFGDQHRNAMRAKRSGYGKILPFFDITNEILLDSVQELLTNKSYLLKAKEVSSIFKANLVPPMQEAIFWIEYVCQFSGASHLKSHAANMTWISYLLLDVLFVAIVSLVAVFIFIRKVFRWCRRRNSTLNNKKKDE